MSDIERVADMLDKHQPNWFIDWADARDLQDYAREANLGKLRTSTAQRIIHRVVNAAIEAGIVKIV